MQRKDNIQWTLFAGLVLVAVGGWFLHIRVHPPADKAANLVPFITGIASVLIIPPLFLFRRTRAAGYILNGMFVILGTITMAHYSIAGLKTPVTLPRLLLYTTLPDILILWSKFALGKALFDLAFLKSETDQAPAGRFFRYPNMGWWWVHLAAMAAVYALGAILW